MDRRNFLKFFGGGLVATATMAEAGALAEFMDWIKRAPSWSFPSKRPQPLWDEVTAATLDHIRQNMILDAYCKPSPLYRQMIANYKSGENYLIGGSKLVESFDYEDAA